MILCYLFNSKYVYSLNILIEININNIMYLKYQRNMLTNYEKEVVNYY